MIASTLHAGVTGVDGEGPLRGMGGGVYFVTRLRIRTRDETEASIEISLVGDRPDAVRLPYTGPHPELVARIGRMSEAEAAALLQRLDMPPPAPIRAPDLDCQADYDAACTDLESARAAVVALCRARQELESTGDPVADAAAPIEDVISDLEAGIEALEEALGAYEAAAARAPDCRIREHVA